MRLVVVGDALLDRDVQGAVRRLAPDAPVPVVEQHDVVVRAGGAGLAAALSAAGGHEVRLVTALARDAAAGELRDALARHGVDVVDVGLDGTTPEKIRIRAQDRALLRLDRGQGGVVGAATAAARAAIAWADAVLVADYGRGLAAEPTVRAALEAAAAGGARIVWDPHPRGAQPIARAELVTPNAAEARGFAPGARGDRPAGSGLGAAADRARVLRARWRADAVAVTCGSAGAVLDAGTGVALVVPAAHVAVGDPCGAGDRFASRAAELLGAGRPVGEAVEAAVAAASAFVAAGGAAGLRADAEPAAGGSVLERVRAEGGTVVATGGCFDLLHPGHVKTLEAARALGDCLVVCLNSDASVRRLKGPARPVVDQHDRAAVLQALGCVDDVLIFDEDTPVQVLQQLRPDLWVKGGDYSAAELPEARVLAAWGGRAVVLPFVEGRSTTKIIEEASLHAV